MTAPEVPFVVVGKVCVQGRDISLWDFVQDTGCGDLSTHTPNAKLKHIWVQ